MTTIQDKTTERRAIHSLSAQTIELKRINESLKEFAYAASHDLQEPLRKIITFSDLLKNDIGRVQLNGQPLAESKVDLNEIVREVLQDFESSIEQHCIHVEVDYLPSIIGDPVQLRQMFRI